MAQRYINQVLEQFFDELVRAEAQAMTLSLRAHLLHEAKKLQETLKALIVQSEDIGHREVIFISTLEHFMTCARLERADTLQASCRLLKEELGGIVSKRSERRSAAVSQLLSGAGSAASLI